MTRNGFVTDVLDLMTIRLCDVRETTGTEERIAEEVHVSGPSVIVFRRDKRRSWGVRRKDVVTERVYLGRPSGQLSDTVCLRNSYVVHKTDLRSLCEKETSDKEENERYTHRIEPTRTPTLWYTGVLVKFCQRKRLRTTLLLLFV